MILLKAFKWGCWRLAKASVDGTWGECPTRTMGLESADPAFAVFYLCVHEIVPQLPFWIMGNLESRVGHGSKMCEAICEAA